MPLKEMWYLLLWINQIDGIEVDRWVIWNNIMLHQASRQPLTSCHFHSCYSLSGWCGGSCCSGRCFCCGCGCGCSGGGCCGCGCSGGGCCCRNNTPLLHLLFDDKLSVLQPVHDFVDMLLHPSHILIDTFPVTIRVLLAIFLTIKIQVTFFAFPRVAHAAWN